MTVIQRPLRGSRISSFYPVKSLPALSSLDSAFQLQEYISLLIRLDVHDVNTIVSVPGKTGASEKGEGGADEAKGEESEKDKDRKSDVAVDEACWIYEQLRRLAQDLSHPLITMLQLECTRASCPEMKAGEWLYLCVAHGNDGAMEQCCAIDYILHTLDSATALLNSPRAFPSRLSVPPSSHRHFSSLARRLGRIFAHAYFHHREAFEQAEAESSLYARFLALTSKFELVPAEFLVIPTPSANAGERGRDTEVQPPRLLGASVARHTETETEVGEEDPHADAAGELSATEWDGKADERGKSPPPGLNSSGAARGGEHSPRRYGRSRTDTMVFSEAFNVAEELAKEHGGQNQEQEAAPAQSHEPEEIAIESADPASVPETETLLIPPIEEPAFAQPAITVSSPEAPASDSVPAEELFAPEDAPISATEIQPAPAPSAALAEELTTSTSPFSPPSEPAPEAAAAVEPAPEVAAEVETADAPDAEAAEEAAPAPDPAAEAEAVPEPAAATEEPGQKIEEAQEPEEAADSKAEAEAEAAHVSIKERDFAVEVASDVPEAHAPETETPVHAPEAPAPAHAEPAAEETENATVEDKPATPEAAVASESHPEEAHEEIAVENPEEPEPSAPAPEEKPDLIDIASVPASKEEEDKSELSAEA